MSSTKRVIFPFKMIAAGNMSTSLLGTESSVAFIDYGKILIQWTGTSPVGNINIEELVVESSRNPDGNIDVWEAINFTDLAGGTDIPISGNTGEHEIIFNKLPFSKLRVRYIRTSGIGTLNVIFTAKEF